MRNDKSSIDVLLEQLADEDSLSRENCIYTIGEIGAEARALRKNTLKTEKQLAVMNALCDENYRAEVVELLLSLEMTKDNAWLRGNIADAVGKIGDPRGVPFLIECLADKDIIVRYSAADALGDVADTSAPESLVAALRDENWGVRLAAARSLGVIGDTSVAEALRSCLSDCRRDVRVVAEDALEMLETSYTQSGKGGS